MTKPKFFRILSITLAVLLMFTLAACDTMGIGGGNDNNGGGNGGDNGGGNGETVEPFVVDLSGNDWGGTKAATSLDEGVLTVQWDGTDYAGWSQNLDAGARDLSAYNTLTVDATIVSQNYKIALQGENWGPDLFASEQWASNTPGRANFSPNLDGVDLSDIWGIVIQINVDPAEVQIHSITFSYVEGE